MHSYHIPTDPYAFNDLRTMVRVRILIFRKIHFVWGNLKGLPTTPEFHIRNATSKVSKKQTGSQGGGGVAGEARISYWDTWADHLDPSTSPAWNQSSSSLVVVDKCSGADPSYYMTS